MRLPTLALLALLSLAFAALLALGVWQLDRNEWKRDLVAESHARTDAPPLAVQDSAALSATEAEYRRVEIEGTWLLDDALFLANRARETTLGEEVIVPVQPASGPAVLVNMGWYPAGARDDVLRTLAERRDTTVRGLAYDGRDRSGFQAPSGGWSGMAPEAMSTALGYDVAEWFVLAGEERTRTASPSEPLPVQGWQRFVNTTPHMEYALTWFGIAAVLVVAAVVRFIVQPRRARTAGDSAVE